MTRGPHFAKVAEPHVGHSPRPPWKASRRSEFINAYCKLEPHVVSRIYAMSNADICTLLRYRLSGSMSPLEIGVITSELLVGGSFWLGFSIYVGGQKAICFRFPLSPLPIVFEQQRNAVGKFS